MAQEAALLYRGHLQLVKKRWFLISQGRKFLCINEKVDSLPLIKLSHLRQAQIHHFPSFRTSLWARLKETFLLLSVLAINFFCMLPQNVMELYVHSEIDDTSTAIYSSNRSSYQYKLQYQYPGLRWRQLNGMWEATGHSIVGIAGCDR